MSEKVRMMGRIRCSRAGGQPKLFPTFQASQSSMKTQSSGRAKVTMILCRKSTCSSAVTISCCSVGCLRESTDCEAEAWASCSAAPEVGLALTKHAARPFAQECMRMVKVLVALVRVAVRACQVEVRQVYARWAPARRRSTCKQLPRSGCTLHKPRTCRQLKQQSFNILDTGQADPRQC